ncbi:hypothetical protein AgCh_028591 [Apium graveolens]
MSWRRSSGSVSRDRKAYLVNSPSIPALRSTVSYLPQRDSASELGFGIPSRASISSVKEDSRKDGIRRRVSRMNKIRVEKGELAKLDKIGMGIGTCIDVPYRLMLPG